MPVQKGKIRCVFCKSFSVEMLTLSGQICGETYCKHTDDTKEIKATICVPTKIAVCKKCHHLFCVPTEVEK